MKEKIAQVYATFQDELASTQTLENLEKIRITYLGRSGIITDLMATLKEMSLEQKREFGPKLNTLKKTMQATFMTRRSEIESAIKEQELQARGHFDVTSSLHQEFGSLHPYTLITREVEDIFMSMGYQVAQGPELETEFNNFTALNIPDNHPAREESDTFWMPNFAHLLRTQTSTVQIRTMLEEKPPIAIIAPGRVYRNEATDASHDFMFMQTEGLLVGKDISMANLLATLNTFLQKLLGSEIKLRVRPGYFPFVEPGIEIDALYSFDANKPAKWMELMGAGLVHPNVLRHCNIDPDVYSGFAFGFGLTRLAMLKYNIHDLRIIHGTNLQFLKQF